MKMNWKISGTSIFNLDSSDIAILETYANGDYRSVRQIARNILTYAYNYHYCNCLNAPDSSYLKDLGSKYSSLNSAFGPEVTVEPNPASSWAAFNYKMRYEESVGVIKIKDLYGKDVQQFRVTGKEGQQVWDTRWIKPGIYFYTLTADGLSKSGKVIVKY